MQEEGQISGGIKADALALAELIYDVFIEEQSGVKMDNGQNNAQPNEN